MFLIYTNCVDIEYQVRIWDADQDMSTANDTLVDFVDRSLEQEVSGLLPAKKYIVRVLAYSLGGDGKMSPPQEIILGRPRALRVIDCIFIYLYFWYFCFR